MISGSLTLEHITISAVGDHFPTRSTTEVGSPLTLRTRGMRKFMTKRNQVYGSPAFLSNLNPPTTLLLSEGSLVVTTTAWIWEANRFKNGASASMLLTLLLVMRTVFTLCSQRLV